MGACESTNSKKDLKGKRARVKMSNISKVENADVNASFNYGKLLNKDSRSNTFQTLLDNNDITKIQELIINKQFPLNEYIFNSKTALHVAVQNSNTETVKFLLLNGADIDKPELETGNSALFLAALDLNVEMVQCLLKFNPNINLRNKKDQNVINLIEETFTSTKSDNNITHFIKKSALTTEEKDRLNTILSILGNYKHTDVETFETEPKNPRIEESFKSE